SAQIREILISESAWEEMTCLFAPSLARLEGEVFGLLFTELNSAQAKIIAERMRKNVELLTGFSNRYDVPEQMTISIGTVFSTGDTRNISLVMTEADKALREAKSEGGNKVIIHHI
ncbi:diguanylate cyclase domain-containing protein, partial [Escherichia coli]|uniref:diguanylate cyclase domain-containing protein n=1 Tax=Escherichia coli TaxID=562 RepID=UPI004068DD80